MDFLTSFAILILIVPAIIIGLLFYFIPRIMGFPKVAKYLTITYGAIVLLFIGSMIFEDQLFFKRDARKLLKEQNIELVDDFKIINNKTHWAVGDYWHTFTLEISSKDKERIINQIKTAKNFRVITEKNFCFPNNELIQNYETDEEFVKNKSEEKKGYYYSYKISIEKKGNTLVFDYYDF